jgi:hypothetical protein
VIDRRTFLAGTGAVLLATPLAAEAQQADRMHRIGVLIHNAEDDPEAKAELWQRLLGRPASECGRLRHGDGNSEGATAANRCRRGLVLTIL